MRRFDGVALLVIDPVDAEAADCPPAGHEAGERPPVDTAELGTGLARPRTERLGARLVDPDGRGLVVRRRPGVPDALRDRRGRWVAVVGLRAAPDGDGPLRAPWSGPAGEDRRLVAVLPPASAVGLLACRPLAGGRIHVARRGQPVTLCGRLPVAGEQLDPGLVDCLRCRRSDVLTERFAAQLADQDQLLDVVDPLTAAALAGWWPRLDHRDPADLPVLLDAMVGARIHALPGAPSDDEVLRQVRRHRAVASTPVLAWAAEQARPRLEQQLRRLLLDPGRAQEDPVRRELALAGALLDAADVADTLVAMLERHGPVPSLEPLVLEVARRAGDRATDRVRRWRRLHAVAAALAPGRHPPRSPSVGHDRLHAQHRAPTGNIR